MIIIGILLNVAGLGTCCWALFTLAVSALPFFVGMTVGIYQIDIGLIGAIIIGFFAGALGLLVGQHIFSAARSPTIRLIVALLFAVPAAYAGYSTTFSIAQVSIASEWWRQAFALVGAVVVGSTAWARLAMRQSPPRRFLRSTAVVLGPSLRAGIPDRRLFCSILSRFEIRVIADVGPARKIDGASSERFDMCGHNLGGWQSELTVGARRR